MPWLIRPLQEIEGSPHSCGFVRQLKPCRTFKEYVNRVRIFAKTPYLAADG
jgi:hypothetical protein